MKLTVLAKKGLSAMIGYILLITAAVVMSLIVYNWMKAYMPTDVPGCPSEVSILIKNVSCDGKKLFLELKNNGRFNIDGYYVKATTNPEQEIATLDLVNTARYPAGFIDLLNEVGGLKPNEDDNTRSFKYSTHIYAIEIIPIRFQENKGKQEFTSCADSKIKEQLPVECQIVA